MAKFPLLSSRGSASKAAAAAKRRSQKIKFCPERAEYQTACASSARQALFCLLRSIYIPAMRCCSFWNDVWPSRASGCSSRLLVLLYTSARRGVFFFGHFLIHRHLFSHRSPAHTIYIYIYTLEFLWGLMAGTRLVIVIDCLVGIIEIFWHVVILQQKAVAFIINNFDRTKNTKIMNITAEHSMPKVSTFSQKFTTSSSYIRENPRRYRHTKKSLAIYTRSSAGSADEPRSRKRSKSKEDAKE